MFCNVLMLAIAVLYIVNGVLMIGDCAVKQGIVSLLFAVCTVLIFYR